MHRILWRVACTLVLADALWIALSKVPIDATGFLLVTLVVGGLGALAFFYERMRHDGKLAAMLSGTAFLVAISAALSALNYLLLPVAGHRIDAPLAAIDRALGFHWPTLMGMVAGHPGWNLLLQIMYSSLLPQIAILVVALGWTGRSVDVFRFCMSVAIGAGICIVVWTAFPSFGAFSVYRLPPEVASHLSLALDGNYANALIHLLSYGPDQISPREARGLIGFPSFHAALALMTCWYALRVRVLRIPAIVLNTGLLIATPIQGGHHLIDVIAGLAVGVAAMAAADHLARATERKAALSATLPLIGADRAFG